MTLTKLGLVLYEEVQFEFHGLLARLVILLLPRGSFTRLRARLLRAKVR